MAKPTTKNQYPAYALKSDDGKNQQQKNQYPAYALKSDDGKNQQSRSIKKPTRFNPAYAANHSDDGEKPR